MTAKADYSVSFVQVVCIPESNYYEVRFRSLPSDAVFDGVEYGVNEVQKRLDIWHASGFYDPRNFERVCKISKEVEYVLTTYQPPARARGMCGADPNISLTFSWGTYVWIDKVTFGGDCRGRASLSRFMIWGEYKTAYPENMVMCIFSKKAGGETCKRLPKGQDFEKLLPITQETIADIFAD